jgi:hypothetical protein
VVADLKHLLYIYTVLLCEVTMLSAHTTHIAHTAPKASPAHLSALQSALHHPRVWQASQSPSIAKGAGVSTGFVALNRELPEAGWSRGALIEIHHATDGIGELSLLLPAIASMTQQRQSIAWILHGQHAHIPNAQALLQAQVDLSKLIVVRAPQLADYHWACEQAMRSGAFSAVVCSLDTQMDYAQLRRLQLACVRGGTVGFALRPAVLSQHTQALDESALQSMLQYQPNPSPSPLRLLLAPVANDQFPQLAVHVFKRRGFAMNEPLLLRTDVQRLTTALRMPHRLPSRQLPHSLPSQRMKTVNIRSESRLIPHY